MLFVVWAPSPIKNPGYIYGYNQYLYYRGDAGAQGRREPNVGPGPAQMWRNSGFVNSETDGDNAAVLSKLWCDLKKKGLHRNSNGFFGQN